MFGSLVPYLIVNAGEQDQIRSSGTPQRLNSHEQGLSKFRDLGEQLVNMSFWNVSRGPSKLAAETDYDDPEA